MNEKDNEEEFICFLSNSENKWSITNRMYEDWSCLWIFSLTQTQEKLTGSWEWAPLLIKHLLCEAKAPDDEDEKRVDASPSSLRLRCCLSFTLVITVGLTNNMPWKTPGEQIQKGCRPFFSPSYTTWQAVSLPDNLPVRPFIFLSLSCKFCFKQRCEGREEREPTDRVHD